MGAYLNPGSSAFAKPLRSEIYVDKTPVARYLNSVARTKRKYVSISRLGRLSRSL